MQRVSTSCFTYGLVAAVVSTILGSCGSSRTLENATTLWSISDPSGDARLRHPDHPQIRPGTFDLTHFELLETETQLIAIVTFAAVIRPIQNVRLSEDRRATIFPQTVDIYLDTTPGAGAVETLPDRNIHIPANEAWDQVLVMSSIRDMHVGGVIYASHLSASGRTLIGTFDKSRLEGTIKGALVLVLASASRGDGRVRLASTFKGVCTDWNPNRCTLLGSGPPILDSTVKITEQGPVALTYFGDAPRPAPKTIPVVFRRGRLIGAAPVTSKRIKQGNFATIFNDKGNAIASAVVVSVVDDTASLEIIGEAAPESATSVAFQESER